MLDRVEASIESGRNYLDALAARKAAVGSIAAPATAPYKTVLLFIPVIQGF
jgi:hypothetical protein